MGFEEVKRDFDLAPEDMRSALDYNAELLNQERNYPHKGGEL